MKVTVVAGGIVGLATAHSLVESGCDVVLLEAQDIPNPSSASCDLNRMMRLQYGPQSGYAQLTHRALAAWSRLQKESGQRLYHQTGVCVWSGTASVWTEATRGALRRARIAYRDVSPNIETGCLFQRTALGDGIFTQQGGVLLAKTALEALAMAAVRKGAVLRPRTEVSNVDSVRGVVRTRTGEIIQSDSVVVAAGAWTAKLLPDLGERLTPIRSIAVYAAPPSELAAAWAAGPCTMIETRESILYALPPVPGAPLKLAGTANLRPADPDRPEPVSPHEAQAVLEAFRPYLPNVDRYKIIGTSMGHYADPPDKVFIVERRDRAIIVSGCGGRMFKFAPLLAEDMAAVITGTAAVTQLDQWSMPSAAPSQTSQ